MTKEHLFRFDYYSWLMRTPCRRRNKMTFDDRVRAMARLREYMEEKKKLPMLDTATIEWLNEGQRLLKERLMNDTPT